MGMRDSSNLPSIPWTERERAEIKRERAEIKLRISALETGGVTFADIDSAAVITSVETLRANDIDTAFPTAAAVLDVVGPQLQTAVTLTTQTSVDFTGIPAWVNRVTVMGRGVSTNGTSNLLQVGDGAIVSTGYLGAVSQLPNATAIAAANSTVGCPVTASLAATSVFRFSCRIERITGNNWLFSGSGSFSSSATAMTFASEVTLTGALDRVRMTTVGGSDRFDAGSVNISWE